MSERDLYHRIAELEVENARLQRYIEELRAALAALLEPAPSSDKDKLWRQTHPNSARRT